MGLMSVVCILLSTIVLVVSTLLEDAHEDEENCKFPIIIDF